MTKTSYSAELTFLIKRFAIHEFLGGGLCSRIHKAVFYNEFIVLAKASKSLLCELKMMPSFQPRQIWYMTHLNCWPVHHVTGVYIHLWARGGYIPQENLMLSWLRQSSSPWGAAGSLHLWDGEGSEVYPPRGWGNVCFGIRCERFLKERIWWQILQGKREAESRPPAHPTNSSWLCSGHIQKQLWRT